MELAYEEGEGLSASTEEQKRKWEDQRQKREKISSSMGQYLLKGYRMLATTCDTCGNILLQKRDGMNYCVQCSEFGSTRSDSDVQPMAAKVESGLKDSSWNCDTARSNQQPTACLVTSKVLGSVQESLVYKLQWASSELQGTTSVEYSTALCQLVKACAEALHSVGATCVAASVPDH